MVRANGESSSTVDFVVVDGLDASSLGKIRRHGLNASRRAIIGGEAQMVAGGVGIASAAIWNR